MANEVKKILSTLGVAFNPLFLVKMLKNIKQFVEQHQKNYPCDETFKTCYLSVGEKLYVISENKAKQIDTIPKKANVICLSSSDLNQIIQLMRIKEVDETKQVNQMLKQMKNSETIKQYQVFLNILEDSFETNLSMNQLAKLGLSQLK